MELIPIREASRTYGVSTRTLRYYEEVGLLNSIRLDNGTYRAYDAEALRSLKQILVLRALRLPLKRIREILQGESVQRSLETLERHAISVAREADALKMIQTALAECIMALRETGHIQIPSDLPDDTTTRNLLQTLSIPIPTIKEEEEMPQLTDVRILYLPPATVCSMRGEGPEAERVAGELLDAFVRERNLREAKPDFRSYGFNNPDGKAPDGSDHGYVLWVTIPDDMEVSAPYEKKRFEGGLYAAHMIPMGAFEEWQWIVDWAMNSKEYEPWWGAEDCMAGLLEEHLNAYSHLGLPDKQEEQPWQLDLLVPIQPRK